MNSILFENNEENLYLNPREVKLGANAEFGRNSASANSSAENNRLSSELNSRISREMDEMMNRVSVQIQRAINDAISSQVLPRIQNVSMAGSGHMTQKGWNVPAARPEIDPDVLRGENSRDNLRSERVRNSLNGESMDIAYDSNLFWNEESTTKGNGSSNKLTILLEILCGAIFNEDVISKLKLESSQVHLACSPCYDSIILIVWLFNIQGFS